MSCRTQGAVSCDTDTPEWFFLYMKKDGFILRDRSDGYPYKIGLWSLRTLTLLFIMILPVGIGAVEAGGTPMWHEPGAAAVHYFLIKR